MVEQGLKQSTLQESNKNLDEDDNPYKLIIGKEIKVKINRKQENYKKYFASMVY